MYASRGQAAVIAASGGVSEAAAAGEAERGAVSHDLHSQFSFLGLYNPHFLFIR